MKLLVACANINPRNIRRQPWYYINSIVKCLSEKGHDVWIMTDKADGWTEKDKVIVMEKFRSFPNGISTETIKTVHRGNFDAIFWSLGLTDFFFKKSVNVFNIPVIGVVTSPRYYLKELLSLGCDLFYGRNLINHFFLGTVLTKQRIRNLFFLPNLKAIIFECKGTMHRFVTDAEIAKKSYVIKPYLPQSYFDMLNRIKGENNPKISSQVFKILYLGPPLNLRGVDTVVKAFKNFHKEVKYSKLFLLSRIEAHSMLKHERRLRTLIRKENIEEAVEIISGILDQEEIVKHLISSNVVCLPFKITISDVPIVTLEVLATGIPLITTDIAGVREFLNENCFIVPPSNPRSIAENLKYIYENNIGKINNPMHVLNKEIDFCLKLQEVLKRAVP